MTPEAIRRKLRRAIKKNDSLLTMSGDSLKTEIAWLVEEEIRVHRGQPFWTALDIAYEVLEEISKGEPK